MSEAQGRPVLEGWTAHYPDEWAQRMRESAALLGDPIYGIAGPLATTGVVSMHSGPPGKPALTLRYGDWDACIQVTSSTTPRGGTDALVQQLVGAAVLGLRPPFMVSVEERLLMLPVDQVRTQFRVVESSTAHWVAVGGLKKRHLMLTGTPGTAPDEIELVSVVLP